MRRRVSHLVLAVFLLLPALSSAQSPNAPRLFELGMDALLGVGPDRDEQSAIDYIRRSADLGYPPAEVVLGYFYETGTIVPSEAGQAAVWYKKAAQQDDPLGEWLLGRLIFTGGIQRDLNEAARCRDSFCAVSTFIPIAQIKPSNSRPTAVTTTPLFLPLASNFR